MSDRCLQAPDGEPPPLFEYLTTAEAGMLLRLRSKTMRNKVAAGMFVEGIHFFRQPGMQLRWKRSALVAWLEGSESRDVGEQGAIPLARGRRVAG
jgi:hypothetical protein